LHVSIRGFSDVIFTLVSYLPPCPTDLLMRSNQEGWVSEATRPTLSDRGCDEDITKTCY